MHPAPNHVHVATVIEWHDGDTVLLDTDQDYETHNQSWHRLYGVDTAELPTTAGKEAKAYVEQIMPPGTKVITVSYKNKDQIPTPGSKEKYGRWLAEIWIPGTETSINQALVRDGYSKPYYGTKR